MLLFLISLTSVQITVLQSQNQRNDDYHCEHWQRERDRETERHRERRKQHKKFVKISSRSKNNAFTCAKMHTTHTHTHTHTDRLARINGDNDDDDDDVVVFDNDVWSSKCVAVDDVVVVVGFVGEIASSLSNRQKENRKNVNYIYSNETTNLNLIEL